jgi:hypothetical protein
MFLDYVALFILIFVVVVLFYGIIAIPVACSQLPELSRKLKSLTIYPNLIYRPALERKCPSIRIIGSTSRLCGASC